MAVIKSKSLTVQSIIFPKSDFNKRHAESWLEENGFRNRKVDEKKNTLRYRQVSPDKMDRHTYVAKKLANGVSLILAKRK